MQTLWHIISLNSCNIYSYTALDRSQTQNVPRVVYILEKSVTKKPWNEMENSRKFLVKPMTNVHRYFVSLMTHT